MKARTAAFARHLAFGDEVAWIAFEPIREQEEIGIGDLLLALFDGLDLVWGEGAAQAARDKTGLFDGGDQLTRGPTLVVATPTNGEAVEANEFLDVGIRAQ